MARGSSARNLYRAVPLGLAFIWAPGVCAQPAKPQPVTVVSAFVWDSANRPVADVTVALRNLNTARVDRSMHSDQDGHVTFRGIDRGTYVLEVVDARGAVIATGQTFSIEVGESLATFVRLAGKSPWYAGLFHNAGAIAVAAAAGLGASAIGVTGQPQSPGR